MLELQSTFLINQLIIMNKKELFHASVIKQ